MADGRRPAAEGAITGVGRGGDGGDQEEAVGSEDPAEFLSGGLLVGVPVEGFAAGDGVEGSGGERELLGVAPDQAGARRGPGRGLGEHAGRQVEAVDGGVREGGGQRSEELAGAAAQVEDGGDRCVVPAERAEHGLVNGAVGERLERRAVVGGRPAVEEVGPARSSTTVTGFR